MVWKPVEIGTSVNITLDDFDDDQLIQALIDRNYLDESEAEKIYKREDVDLDEDYECVQDVDMQSIDTAMEYAVRGDKHEALVWIERALGGEWIGRLA